MSASPTESPSPSGSPEKSSRKRGREVEGDVGPDKKLKKNMLYGKTLAVRAFMLATSDTTIQHGGKTHSDFPIAIFNALWKITVEFLCSLHGDVKFPTPSFSRNIESMWPGKSFILRYKLLNSVPEALAAAEKKTGVVFKRSQTRVNLRLRSEEEMRQTFEGSPGYELVHLLFAGDEGQYHNLVTQWWAFLTPYLGALVEG